MKSGAHEASESHLPGTRKKPPVSSGSHLLGGEERGRDVRGIDLFKKKLIETHNVGICGVPGAGTSNRQGSKEGRLIQDERGRIVED